MNKQHKQFTCPPTCETCYPEETEAWEKEFDKEFSIFDGWQKIIKHVTYSAWVKAFIVKERTQAAAEERVKIGKLKREVYMRGASEERKRVVMQIGQLRQWLNEDRITDPKKMVTNEELAVWLIEEAIQK